jgi:cell division septation protein DedD
LLARGTTAKSQKISDSISRPDSNSDDMPPNSSNPAAPPQQPAKSSTGRRLIAAVVLIGLATGGLALVDRFRQRPAGLTPPHEPSEALITPPAAGPNLRTANPEQPITPPPPPKIINNETLVPPSRATSSSPLPQAAADGSPAEKIASTPGKAYLVQVGVFRSPANAQALQKQLRRAGIEAHLETRVQIGPFKDKRDADKALVRAKKLGINAVLVGSR